MVSYEKAVANLKKAYAVLRGGSEHNAGLSAGSAFSCQCAVKDALALLEEMEKPKRESRAMLPCKCGCKRREHWLSASSEKPEGLKCMKCGFKVWGTNQTDVIRQWNKAVQEVRGDG